MGHRGREQERLSCLLRELAAHDARIESPAQVQRTVMRRWKARLTGAGSRFTPPPPLPERRRSVWTSAGVSVGVAGIAASLLLIAWDWSRPLVSPELPAPPRKATFAEVPSLPMQEFPANEALSRRGASEGQHSAAANPAKQPFVTAANRAAPVSAGVPSAADQIEPFVRLLPISEQELGTIRLARVRLRGQAAQTLALDAQMPPLGVGEFVEADVLLGEDGLARAIRFVR